MTDLFGNYKTQTTLALQSIQSSKYPDTNKDFEANVRRLNEFVDYIAQYLQTMQKGVDQANQDPITQIRTTVLDIGSLLGGGEILYGIDLGDLQYYLPALAAMFGFDSDQPFPINLLYAAEHFFAGFIVPLDAWAPAVEDVIDGWAAALGINPEFIASVHDLLDAIQAITSDFTLLFNTLGDVLSIFGISDGNTSLFADIWHSITVLLGSLSLKDLGAATDPVFKALAPWIEDIAIAVNDLDQIIKSFSGGVTDLAGILNFASIFTGIIPNFNIPSITTDPLSAWADIFAGALQPLQYFGDLGTLFGGLLGSTNIVGAANALFSRLTAALVPVLDATKITTGQFASTQLQPLINAIATGFGGSSGLNFSGLTSLLSSLPGAQQLIDAISNALGHPGTGHTTSDVLTYLGAIPGSNIASLLSALVIPSLDASKITTGTFASPQLQPLINSISTGFGGSTGLNFTGLTSLLSGLPGAQQLTDAISNALGHSGTGHTANDVLGYLGLIPGANIASAVSASVVPALDASKITTGLLAAARIASLPASQITSGIFGTAQIPNLPASIINSGSFLAAQIPNLDASKITTGQFAQSFLNITSIAAGIVTGTLGVGQIPSLPAGQITSGIFGTGLIPSLDASKITTGTFADTYLPGLGTLRDSIGQAIYGGALSYTAAQVKIALGVIPGANIASAVAAAIVPSLDASKITSGIFGTTQIPSLDAGKITTGTLLSSLIPSLPASIITSGIFPAAQIPALDATKITSGILALAQIPGIDVTRVPSLPASQITSGIFGAGLIPSLDATKITTGVLATGLIPNITKAMSTDLTKVFGIQNSSTTAGANMVTNPGFENSNLAFTTGFAAYSTEQKHSGTQSAKYISSGNGYPFFGLIQTDITDDVRIPVIAGDVFYVECWIYGKSTNANVTGQLWLQASVYDKDGAYFGNPQGSRISGGDAVKGTWTKMSSYLTMPANSATAMFNICMDGANIANGTAYYIDDPVIYRVTESVATNQALYSSNTPLSNILAAAVPGLDATKIATGTFAQSMVSGLPAALAASLTSTSPLNAQYLFNQVPSSLVGMVPYSHIGNASPNLIAASGFDNAASVTANPGWGWDGTDGYTTNGCASATANGSLLQLVSNIIQVAPGQTLNIGARVKHVGLTATAGQNAIQIVVAQYSGSIPGATTMVASIASPSGSSAGFLAISGNYTVPASGVDNIVVQLVVTQAATAGTVKYDDAFAYKTGLMSGNWMSGISSTVAADIQSAVDQIFQATQGGASTGNALSTIKNNLLNIPGPNIISALGAGVIPGLDASKIISGALSLLRIPSLPTSQITSGTFLASLIPTLDASKVVSGVLGLAQIPTNLLNKSNISDIQIMSDQLTNSLIGTGNTYTGTDILSQARPSMDAIYNNVMNAVNSLQALRSQSTATNISGVNVNINFQNYADGPLPSNFTVTYSGPGTSTIGVSGGVAGFTNLVNNGNRRAFIVWNSGPTNTDFQIVRGTMSSPPSGSGSGGQPYIYAMGRVDNPANPQNFVWARAYCTGFLTYKADLGYTVAGVETVMLGNIGLTWSLDINVLFGANANPRRYQAYSGTQLVFDYIESGTNSKLGAGYRYWGCVAQMVTGSGGAVSPGGIAATSVSDNAPPNVLGSTFRVSRHNTATVNYANSGAGAPVKIGANFFDTLDWISPDMTWDGQNVTVNTEGTYLCVLRLNTNSIPGNTKFTPVIYQNNVAEAMVGGGFSDGSFSAQAVGGTGAGAIVYVKAGDFFSAGTAADGGGKLAGDSLGMSSYFEMALLNRSMQ